MIISSSQSKFSQSCCQSYCSPLSLISILFFVAIPAGEFLDYFIAQDWKDAKPLDWVFFSLFLVITSALCIGVHRWAINKVKKTSDLSMATLFLAPQCPVLLYILCNTIKLIAEWWIEGNDAKEEFGQENLQNAILASLTQKGFLTTTGLMLSTQVANVLLDGTVRRKTQNALGCGEDTSDSFLHAKHASLNRSFLEGRSNMNNSEEDDDDYYKTSSFGN